MAGTTGREMKGFAFAKCGTNSWNVAASVTKGSRFSTDGGLTHSPQFIEDRSYGETFLGPSEQGDTNAPDLPLTGQARYEDFNYVLEALVMGSPAVVALSSSASGQVTSWSHVMDLAPSIDGLCITAAIDRKLYVEELTSAKVYGLSETFGDGGIVNQTFKVLGGKTTTISSININSTVYGASYPALNGKIFRNQGTFRLNAQGGGGLASGDAIIAEGIEFSFERPQDRSYGTGSDAIIEPADNEFPEPMVKATFPRMNTVTANSLARMLRTSAPAYKMDVTYLGAFINSTDRYTKLIQAPYAELQAFETPTAGAAQVKPVATFKLKKPASAPTGMSGVVTPFRITRIMVNSVNAFA
jgi:hypothetical protein